MSAWYRTMDRNELSRRALLLLAVGLISDQAAARGGGRGGGRGGWRGGRGGRGNGAGGLVIFLFIAIVWGGLWAFGKLFGRKPDTVVGKTSLPSSAALPGTTPRELAPSNPARPPREKWSELGLCPRCGSSMRLKTAKTGRYAGRSFMGCSTYPRCRGIRNT